jgi:glycosyltransferase involved in cell wall biosynthesis
MYDTIQADSRAIFSEFDRRKDLVFLGGYSHKPNVDAVLWFTGEVLPLVLKKIPDLVFHIGGSNVTPEVQSLESANVKVHGFVPDLAAFFSAFRVFVAPLRFGAGVKGKIVSSLVHGVPVITTSIGNEGIDLVDGTQALVADSAEEFAQRVCALYEDQETWCKLSGAGIGYVNQHFSVDAARITIQDVLKPRDTTPPTTRTN